MPKVKDKRFGLSVWGEKNALNGGTRSTNTVLLDCSLTEGVSPMKVEKKIIFYCIPKRYIVSRHLSDRALGIDGNKIIKSCCESQSCL